MFDCEFQRLKTAFGSRVKPSSWVRENLNRVDDLDARDFVREVESGRDRAHLFQSAIPYFAFLTGEARLFLFPDYLRTLALYPHQILDTVCELEEKRGQELLASLFPAERQAVVDFIVSLSKWEGMSPYSRYVQKLLDLVTGAHRSSESKCTSQIP